MYLKAWVADQDFTTLGSVQTWWGKKDSVQQMGVFWDVAVKFFHCFYNCRETHIWTGISKSKCQGLSHFCTGVPCQLCHVVLCSNLWALNFALSLGYLSSSAPLYAACFLLVWLHFTLVQRVGFTAHPKHQRQGNICPSCLMRYLIFFPAHVFVHWVCLCMVRKVPAAISGALVCMAEESRGAAMLAAQHFIPVHVLAFPPKLWLRHQGRVECACLCHLVFTCIAPSKATSQTAEGSLPCVCV